MEFVIKDATPKPQTPNSFEVDISTIIGDDEGYQSFVVGPFIKDQDEYALQNLIETLTAMTAIEPNGMADGEHYDELPEFRAWFKNSNEYANEDEDEVPLEPWKNVNPKWSFYWVTDAYSYEHNRYKSYTVYYYDENLVQHSVYVQL
jgi:hypothetical protein